MVGAFRGEGATRAVSNVKSRKELLCVIPFFASTLCGEYDSPNKQV